jgi:hypothetical protein
MRRNRGRGQKGGQGQGVERGEAPQFCSDWVFWSFHLSVGLGTGWIKSKGFLDMTKSFAI